jgi:hypothetical protein
MSAGEQVDLFPWILGTLLMAAAIPAVIALKGSPLKSPPLANAPMTSSPISVPPPVVQTAPRPEIEPLRQAPQPPTGQVWQCVVNGQKIFSDSRCGADASVRQLSEVNRMAATPVSRAPAYPAYPMYPTAYPEDYPDQDAPAENSASSPFIVINERGRHEDGRRTHHPEHRSGQSRGGLIAR